LEALAYCDDVRLYIPRMLEGNQFSYYKALKVVSEINGVNNARKEEKDIYTSYMSPKSNKNILNDYNYDGASVGNYNSENSSQKTFNFKGDSMNQKSVNYDDSNNLKSYTFYNPRPPTSQTSNNIRQIDTNFSESLSKTNTFDKNLYNTNFDYKTSYDKFYERNSDLRSPKDEIRQPSSEKKSTNPVTESLRPNVRELYKTDYRDNRKPTDDIYRYEDRNIMNPNTTQPINIKIVNNNYKNILISPESSFNNSLASDKNNVNTFRKSYIDERNAKSKPIAPPKYIAKPVETKTPNSNMYTSPKNEIVNKYTSLVDRNYRPTTSAKDNSLNDSYLKRAPSASSLKTSAKDWNPYSNTSGGNSSSRAFSRTGTNFNAYEMERSYSRDRGYNNLMQSNTYTRPESRYTSAGLYRPYKK
jgi:hypothetical protein